MLSSASATVAGSGYKTLNAGDLRWSRGSGQKSAAEAKASTAPYSGSSGATPPARYASDPVAGTAAVPPAGHVKFPTADLVDRSAFLFGLLQSDHLVHDVHDAIALVNSHAVDKPDDDDAKSRTGGGPSNGEGALSAVFYFVARAPSPDMPWRPIYTSAVLLCVFVTVAAAQRAVARINGVVLHTVQTEVQASTSAAPPARMSSSYLVLRPAREFVLGPESTDTALLTYLTTPRLVDLLLRRQRLHKPHDSASDDAEQRSAIESHARANVPPGYLCGSTARLYAAILSPQSPYAVDWAAARVAMARGDGIVVPEMSVVEPWACGGAGEFDRGKDSAPTAAGSPPSERGSPPLLEGADIERRRRAGAAGAERYVPMTLQEEEYYRRYGPGSLSIAGSSRARRGSVEGLTELMPSRGSLYRGAQGILRGVSWFWRCAYEGIGGKEAALSSGPSSLTAAPMVPSALPQAPPGLTGSLNQAPLAGSTTSLREERDLYEPPRARRRTEGTGSEGVYSTRRGGGQAIMIPRYNVIGSALSWLPGFHYVAPLFVTGVFPLGGTTPPPPQRRRMREEEGGDLQSSVWSEKETQLFGIAPGDAWRRDGSQAPPYSLLDHAQMSAPVADTAAWGTSLWGPDELSKPRSSDSPSVSWSSPPRPSQSFTSPSPQYSGNVSQGAPGAALHLGSRLPTPTVSSIAPTRSCMPLHGSSLASSSETTSMSALWKSHATDKSDSVVASSRGNRNFIRVDGVRTAGGGSGSAHHMHSAGSGTPLAAGVLGDLSATRPSGTLADELRAFGSGAVEGLRGRIDGQDEVRTTAVESAVDSRGEKKSSSRASRRTVEFRLPEETQ
ncbi:hypothetical protein GH5_08445 [Leishmania sp. Ghana 2012 LV757]|uniref:hypothetical protein n=1 Tax=Leishmania sp. Ghana 2012 LV757 TaxID=2803181 RepID=UPI001B42301D|nr:hypothetical protein GH5_08445 [Leishmania sp. Ghana 2012 LV757]